VFDNNAYTVTSIYHGGQLKMYTSHPAQPTSPGNIETFRQGATYYRNARDWTKEQRDEVIRLANERSESQAGMLAVDASFGLASSFASEVTLEEDYTRSQESRNLLNEGSSIPTWLGLGSQPRVRR
jgi:hypothetical protein